MFITEGSSECCLNRVLRCCSCVSVDEILKYDHSLSRLLNLWILKSLTRDHSYESLFFSVVLFAFNFQMEILEGNENTQFGFGLQKSARSPVLKLKPERDKHF